MKETIERPYQWFFILFTAYFLYVLGIIIIPFGLIKAQSVKILAQVLAYIFFLLILSKLIKKKNFSIRTLINPTGIINYKKMFKAFGLYLAALSICSLLRYLFWPEAFHLTLNYKFFTLLLLATLIFTPVQVLFEEIIFHCYPAHFFTDAIPNDSNKKIVIYSLVTSLIFAIMHVKNPEFNWQELYLNFKDVLFFLHNFSYFFIFSFFLMFVSLKSGSFETAIGIHWANNFFIDFFLGYENSVTTRMPIFYRSDNVQFLILTELILCLAFVLIFIRKDFQKK